MMRNSILHFQFPVEFVYKLCLNIKLNLIVFYSHISGRKMILSHSICPHMCPPITTKLMTCMAATNNKSFHKYGCTDTIQISDIEAILIMHHGQKGPVYLLESSLYQFIHVIHVH